MKSLLLCALVALLCVQSEGLSGFWDTVGGIFGIREKNPCERDPVPFFKQAVDDFTVRLTKRAAFYTNHGNFVISPYSIWVSLASISEFTEESLKSRYFQALGLPEESCIRNKIYLLASSIEIPGPDVEFRRKRVIAIDQQKSLPNQNWLTFNQDYKTLEYLPIDDFDQSHFDSIREAMGIKELQLPFYGNSILLDRFAYNGLWTSAFSDGIFEFAPFYNDLGESIASIEYMRMKSRVRLAHIPFIDAKVLELPVGIDGRYRMLFTMGVKSNTIQNVMDLWRSSIIVEILRSLALSTVPIDVAIPKYFMEYGFNAKPALDDLGFAQIFSDPSATRYIADPPALPNYYFQKLEVNISSGYLQRESKSGPLGFFEDTASSIASVIGRDFIANRPFFFSLIDSKTGVTIFTGLYAYPEETNLPLASWRS